MLTFLATREHLDKLYTGRGPSLFRPSCQPGPLATLPLRFQIAQKLHACTDPHDPPASINDRPRDVVDLLLLRHLVRTEGRPTLLELRVAAEAIFAARAVDD